MRRPRKETMTEQLMRFRGVIFVVSVPLILIAVVLLLMPRTGPSEFSQVSDPLERRETDRSQRIQSGGVVVEKMAEKEDDETENKPAAEKYAVIIDCGSTGSRVHVYRFSDKLELLEMNGELELFVQKKPGLSSFAADPKLGGDSLRELLDKSLAAVPEHLRLATPVFVGATAGLRLLPGEQAELLLKEVRKVLGEYPFTNQESSVKILDGADEGSFAWVTVNFLLGNLGKGIDSTVGVIDLGGGSVQMTYAVSEDVATSAPEGYIRKLSGMGKSYFVYVYSHLGFGLMAARAAVLRLAEKDGHSCLAKGVKDVYKYGSEEFQALAKEVGGDYSSCAKIAINALKLKAPCKLDKCSFGGIWSGGGGEGMAKLYVASYFFDRASQLGVIPDGNAAYVEVKPAKFSEVAVKVCSTPLDEVVRDYPLVDKMDAAYACLDIAYQYNLLTSGFGIDPNATITLVKKIAYKGKEVEAAWPLGAAIDAMS
eukprot:jgi/Mesen1/7594/ME000395S06750